MFSCYFYLSYNQINQNSALKRAIVVCKPNLPNNQTNPVKTHLNVNKGRLNHASTKAKYPKNYNRSYFERVPFQSR